MKKPIEVFLLPRDKVREEAFKQGFAAGFKEVEQSGFVLQLAPSWPPSREAVSFLAEDAWRRLR